MNHCVEHHYLLLLLISNLLLSVQGHRDGTRMAENLNIFPDNIPKNETDVILTENNISTLEGETLKGNPNIKVLHLDYNSIRTSSDIRPISELKHLREIVLSNNFLETMDFGVFKENMELESITADNNPGLEISDSPVNLPNVRKIALQNCTLLNLPLNALSGFTELETLDLSDNNISSIPETLPKILPKLKALCISNNTILGPISPPIYLNREICNLDAAFITTMKSSQSTEATTTGNSVTETEKPKRTNEGTFTEEFAGSAPLVSDRPITQISSVRTTLTDTTEREELKEFTCTNLWIIIAVQATALFLIIVVVILLILILILILILFIKEPKAMRRLWSSMVYGLCRNRSENKNEDISLNQRQGD